MYNDKEYHRQYYAENRDNLIKYSKEYSINNRDTINHKRREYYKKNKDKFKKSSDKWKMNHREQIRLTNQKYNAKYKQRNKESIKEKRQQSKQIIKDYLKDKCCEHCKTKDNLCFHHIDPTTKTFTISQKYCYMSNHKIVMDEISKCIILCRKCHRIEHGRYQYLLNKLLLTYKRANNTNELHDPQLVDKWMDTL